MQGLDLVLLTYVLVYWRCGVPGLAPLSWAVTEPSSALPKVMLSISFTNSPSISPRSTVAVVVRHPALRFAHVKEEKRHSYVGGVGSGGGNKHNYVRIKPATS